MILPDGHPLTLTGGVIPEPSAAEGRIILWLRGERSGNYQYWERVSSVARAGMSTGSGIRAIEAASIPARQYVGGTIGKLFRRRDVAGADRIWTLPDGSSAEQAGPRRTDVVLAWAEDNANPIDEAKIRARWGGFAAARPIGVGLLLVSGVDPTPPVPALDGLCPPRSAIEAIINGLPVVASDRGGLPEVLGNSGLTLSLPDRITPATRLLPTSEEVAPWVEAIIRLWDDRDYYADHRRRAAIEARRWDIETLGRRYANFFRDLRPQAGPNALPAKRAKAVVLVPHLNGIEHECEIALQGLERLGVRIRRRRGSSAIDVARNEMASDALHDGFESILFIDADIAFDPYDALRLLARPEPVVSGLYAKKSLREMASTFSDGIDEVQFGPDSPGLYPLKFAAAGFLRIRATVLRRMIAELNLPLCNLDWGRGCWPFFLPLVVDGPSGKPHYLGEDWAFSQRLRQIGITPLADATIRLWHHGTYAYGWEDAGEDRPRRPSYTFRP